MSCAASCATRIALVGCLSMLAGTAMPPAELQANGRANDLGRFGTTWPVIEPDLLAMIDARLTAAKNSGELDRLNSAFAARARARVVNPSPVAGLTPASERRHWTYDPTIEVPADIHDDKGRLIAARGTRVNPLDLVSLPRMLIFIAGTSEHELAWAQAQGDDSRIAVILVSGSPFARMKTLRRRIWFDQNGALVRRFGIAHTPALVRQRGRVLEIEEVVVPPTAQGEGVRS